MIALDQMEHGGLRSETVAAELGSSDASLRETAAWIAGRHPQWGEALAAALGERLRSTGLTGEASQELRQQLGRLARSEAIQKLLAARLTDASAPENEKRVVLGAMSAAGLKETPRPWVEALGKALSSNDPALLADAVSAARRLPPRRDGAGDLPGRLLQIAARDDVPTAVRVEALAGAPPGELSPPLFDFVSAQLAPEQSAALRTMAADVLARAKLSRPQFVALTGAVRSAGPLEIGRLLAAYENAADDEVGMRLVAALKEAKSARSLRADTVRPRLAKFGPRVQKEAEPLLAQLDPDAAAQKQRLEQMLSSLPKGDVRRGQAIFMSQSTACATCHAIGYLGGDIGPDLTRIGSVRQERDLLESIIFPSASFTQSYEPVLVDTADGDRHSGIVRKNDAEEVVLVTGPTQELRLPRDTVKEMRPGTVSVMPTGLEQQLSPQELADLVAFLKACQ
jgi:putative heme-binding domain-containing protein